MKEIEATLKEKVEYTEQLYSIFLEVPQPFVFKAGQYVFADLNQDTDDIIRRRAYSIASPPYKKTIEIAIRKVEGGFMSNFLATLKPGDKIKISEPLGNFVLRDTPKDKVFLGAGCGISPLWSMVFQLISDGFTGEMWLFYGVRNRKDLIYNDVFKKMEQHHKNFHYIPVVSREPGWGGPEGHVQNVIEEVLGDVSGKEVYICGLKRMVEESRAKAEELGVPKESIFFERYT